MNYESTFNLTNHDIFGSLIFINFLILHSYAFQYNSTFEPSGKETYDFTSVRRNPWKIFWGLLEDEEWRMEYGFSY